MLHPLVRAKQRVAVHWSDYNEGSSIQMVFSEMPRTLIDLEYSVMIAFSYNIGGTYS